MITAYAYWKGDSSPVVGQFNAKSKQVKTPEEQFASLWKKFKSVVTGFNPRRVVIESVQVYASAHSMMCATTGDLIKLTLIVGGYCNILDREGIKYELIPAVKWKGQLTKEATKVQVQLINGETYRSEHITDAVALGLYTAGYFPLKRRER